MSAVNPEPIDAAIVGAGPSGASCAIWLARLGFRPVVIEATHSPGGATARSPYRNEWLATSPSATGEELARQIGTSLERAGVDVRFGTRVGRIAKSGGVFAVETPEGGAPILARHVVLAAGCVAEAGGLPDDPRILVGPGAHVFHHDFAGLDVAVLGGGDNGFENAAFVRGKGARTVHVYARTVRARPDFVAAVPPEDVRQGPYEVGGDGDGLAVNGRRYDRLLVMYGFRPDLSLVDLPLALQARGVPATNPLTAETSVPGLYAVGELSGRSHPCVATALGDGVVAAKAIEAALRPG